MKKFLSVILACALAIGGSVAAVAAEPHTAAPADSITAVLGDRYSLEDLIETRAPAPPLTNMQVLWVNSEQAGEENIGSNQMSTSYDHGGSWFQAMTIEVGYSSTRKATFDGSSMQLTDFQVVDLNGDRIVDGFVCLWTSNSSFTSGQFVSEARSSNSPWNTMETWIGVR